MTARRSSLATLEAGARRRFVLEQRIRYAYEAPVTDVRQHLRIVPAPRHGAQSCRDWQLEITGVEPAGTVTSVDTWGNVTTEITIPAVADAFELTVRVEADTSAGEGDGSHRIAADGRYLEVTPLTTPDAAIAGLVGSGPSDAATLCRRVNGALTYEWGITGVHTSAAEALAGGRGVCQDYAHIMLAACRLAGLPARYVSGHLVGEGGSHAWVEVLHPVVDEPGVWSAEGWDPTHDRRAGTDYLVVAVGPDYREAAPLWGSYEGDGVGSTLTVTKRLSA